jgi:TPR repeat protein
MREMIGSMMNRRILILALTASLSITAALCQQSSGAPATPQKPYRERLLDRARNGEAEAQFELGKNYETGRIGLPKDFAQAQYWYRKAADQGDPYAEASLGILFNFGKGVPRDYAQAYMWYERAVMHSQGGNKDSIVEMRDGIAENLTPQQIAEAKRLARAWKAPPKQ